MKFKEEDIQKMMKKLDLTREEAIQLLQDDENDISVDLTPEQKKVAKEMAQADRKKETVPRKRTRKPDEIKRFLIQQFADLLVNENGEINAENMIVIKPEREIEFIYNNEKYRLILQKPRKEK